MARGRGEYTFKQVGSPLFEETVGEVTVRLIAEYDSAAEDPQSTLRLRSGRVLDRGEIELITNGVTFTGDNYEAMLAVYPKILAKVREFGARLPKKSKNGPVKSSTASAVEAELAKHFASPVVDLPAAPVASGGKKARKF